MGLGIDSTGDVYVTDAYNRVQKFAGNGTFLTSFGSTGPGNGQMVFPTGVAVKSPDYVFVVDSGNGVGTGNNRIEVFSPSHDLAVTSVTVSRSTSYIGVASLPVKVNVTVSNFGLSLETVTARALANSTVIGGQNITLSPGQSRVLSFSWSPSLLIRGVYQISGQVQAVPGEANIGNNILQGPNFFVRMKGDVNGDCKVDIVDLASEGSSFGSTPGILRWNTNTDLNNDGVVNVVDLVLVASAFGQSC